MSNPSLPVVTVNWFNPSTATPLTDRSMFSSQATKEGNRPFYFLSWRHFYNCIMYQFYFQFNSAILHMKHPASLYVTDIQKIWAGDDNSKKVIYKQPMWRDSENKSFEQTPLSL